MVQATQGASEQIKAERPTLMKFTFDKAPIAKMRPRLGKHTVFDAQAKEKWDHQWLSKQQMKAEGYLKLDDGPIEATMVFYLKTPQKFSKELKSESEGQWCFQGKDVDNMAKFYLDVLNGIAYSDDRMVARLFCEKVYSQTPRVVVEINPLTGRGKYCYLAREFIGKIIKNVKNYFDNGGEKDA